ncbi:ATP-binding protein [Kribbella catacumbae]|uniref:ATP-binding protein n=1 Tax=Kribbella catacumbae TaxID=460086 RepID=UPI000379DE6D|nr:AAA family ATPase [Kribbella catacumbae]
MVRTPNRSVLEREQELAVIAEAVRDAAAGKGCVLLVSGEAGIGKSTLVGAARNQIPADGRVLVGQCDDLTTPRALGPFRDLDGDVGCELAAAVRGGADRDRLLTALRSELNRDGRPTLLAVEDVHWADEAMLDVLQYLVRRIAALPAALLLTYCDDLAADHPVRRLLATASENVCTRHLPLRRLTLESVRQLSIGTSSNADEVFAVTAGNPFLVSEVLASGATDVVPGKVIDAVQSRIRNLPLGTLAAVEQLAVLPCAIDRWLAEELTDGDLTELAEAEERGLMAVTDEHVSFRHELTRRAIADRLPASRRLGLNERALIALVRSDGADVAQIAYHASEAGDQSATIRYGTAAARDAAADGAHREAVRHYRLVLEHADMIPPVDRAGLLEEYAIESYTIDAGAATVVAQQQAIDLRRTLKDDAAVGAGLRWLSRMHWQSGDRRAAEAAALEAVAVLEPLGDSRLLALAYSHQAQLATVAHRWAAALPAAERAVALAHTSGDKATLSFALNNLGECRLGLGDAGGLELMETSLQLALDAGETDAACRAYDNIAARLIERLRIDDAEQYVVPGVKLAEHAQATGWLNALQVHRAKIELNRGTWDGAVQAAESIVRAKSCPNRCTALGVMGRVGTRRGDSKATELVSSAATISRQIGDLRHLGWVAAVAAEAAWLKGERAAVADLVGDLFNDAYREELWTIWPELGYWLTRSGHPVEMSKTGGPYQLLAAGNWREAAEIWEAAGCRYEAAMARSESGSPEQLLAAVEELDALGAKPLARITRQRLRGLGICQGSARTPQQNPAGLTARQFEVMQLLVEGLTNTEIASRLAISVRTADNHVAAVLDKLAVHNRADAVRSATQFLGQ